MPKTIFINLPVGDVPKATAFYSALGFTLNPAFSSEQASAMAWSDTIHVMLLDRAFYSSFTDKQIIDAKTQSSRDPIPRNTMINIIKPRQLRFSSTPLRKISRKNSAGCTSPSSVLM